MKERPILFSAPMVRALLDGSKTQTRRMVKLQIEADDLFTGGWRIDHKRGCMAVDSFNRTLGMPVGSDPVICPYGRPGDRLWVRESWHQRGEWRLPALPEADWDDAYWAGAKDVLYAADAARPERGWRGRPSIHMPRWASRILLEITGVRVERLQDIGTEDIEAEGVVTSDEAIMEHGCRARVLDWQRLWESINGAGSWDANPWVWVVEFKRVTP